MQVPESVHLPFTAEVMSSMPCDGFENVKSMQVRHLMSLKRTGPKKGDRPALRMALHVLNWTGQVQGVPFDVSRQRFFWLDDGPLIPPGNSCIKSRGLSSKNRFILYRGFPLWLGFTGEGCDSIEVSGCQTRAWRSTFYIKASLVHMVLGVLIFILISILC